MNNQKYSHSKTSLSQEEKETLLNYNLVKKMIKKNRQKIESVFLELNLFVIYSNKYFKGTIRLYWLYHLR